MPIKFEATREESELIAQIVKRARGLGLDRSVIDLLMDVEACHCNGCPLDLPRLLAADDFNLMHDVGGIVRHLSRDTGELLDCFWPRFAAPTPTQALIPTVAARLQRTAPGRAS